MSQKLDSGIALKEDQRIYTTKTSQTYRKHHRKTSSALNPQKKPKSSDHSSGIYSKPLSKQKPKWNQSSSTWRHSSPQHKFSKANRFSSPSKNNLDILQLQIPNTRVSVSCTLGKGQRQPISIITLRNAKQKPSSDTYQLQRYNQETRLAIKGRTFGSGRQTQIKRYIDHRKDVYLPHFTIQNPSHIYNISKQKQASTKHKRFIMAERLKMFTQKIPKIYSSVPGPKYLLKDRHLYGERGLNDNSNSFTISERIDFSKPQNLNPGPQYNIKGFCQKLRNNKSIQN